MYQKAVVTLYYSYTPAKHHINRTVKLSYTRKTNIIIQFDVKYLRGVFLLLVGLMSKFSCPHYATLSKSIKFISRLIVILSYIYMYTRKVLWNFIDKQIFTKDFLT